MCEIILALLGVAFTLAEAKGYMEEYKRTVTEQEIQVNAGKRGNKRD